MNKAILHIQGKGGGSLKSEGYKNAYTGDFPWGVQNQIQAAYDKLREMCGRISISANRIGAYLAVHTLQIREIKNLVLIACTGYGGPHPYYDAAGECNRAGAP